MARSKEVQKVLMYVIRHSSCTDEEFSTELEEALENIDQRYGLEAHRTDYERKEHYKRMENWKANGKNIIQLSTDFEMTSGEIDDIKHYAFIANIPYSSTDKKIVVFGAALESELEVIEQYL